MTEYRKNVGIVVYNNRGKVFAGKKSHGKRYTWQMPQGGIKSGEQPYNAALRELYEETGIRNIKFIARLHRELYYNFPYTHCKYKGRNNGQYKGQKQKWFLFFFTGTDEEVNVHISRHNEFTIWEWVDLGFLAEQIIFFKKDIYKEINKCFSPLIKQSFIV